MGRENEDPNISRENRRTLTKSSSPALPSSSFMESSSQVASQCSKWLRTSEVAAGTEQEESSRTVTYVPKGSFARLDAPDLSELQFLARSPKARSILSWLCNNIRSTNYIQTLKSNALLQLALSGNDSSAPSLSLSPCSSSVENSMSECIETLQDRETWLEEETKELEAELTALRLSEKQWNEKVDHVIDRIIQVDAFEKRLAQTEQALLQVVNALRLGSERGEKQAERFVSEWENSMQVELQQVSLLVQASLQSDTTIKSCTEGGTKAIVEQQIGHKVAHTLKLRDENAALEASLESVLNSAVLDSDVIHALKSIGCAAAAKAADEILREMNEAARSMPTTGGESHDDDGKEEMLRRLREKISNLQKQVSRPEPPIYRSALSAEKSSQELVDALNEMDKDLDILVTLSSPHAIDCQSKPSQDNDIGTSIRTQGEHEAEDRVEDLRLSELETEMMQRYEASLKSYDHRAVMDLDRSIRETEQRLADILRKSREVLHPVTDKVLQVVVETENKVQEWWEQPGQHTCDDLLQIDGESLKDYLGSFTITK